MAAQTGVLNRGICWLFALAEGRWNDFLEYAADPRLTPGGRQICLIQAAWRGYPVPDDLLDKEVRLRLDGSDLETAGAFEAVAYAAMRGWWEDYERWLAAMRNMPRHVQAVPMLEGYALWRSGDPEGARATLENSAQWPPVRLWLGHINMELGRPEVARGYYSSFFVEGQPWTRSLYYLGLAYEEMGELEKAQEAYAEYLDIWKNADPELEPMKEQAVLRLEAILAERG
jgi:tetratricopeptide (TPR) repeat protein